jgi:allophanate hydrolase
MVDRLGDIPSLLRSYETGELTPRKVVESVHAMIADDPHHVWIHKLPLEAMMAFAQQLESRVEEISALPLYGVPFAIKDNIDLAGVPTTAACPAFSYTPPRNATVVQRLIDAGAIPVGKTNLDQFATGLNGTRSPYGPCHNAFNSEYISGGSSSGSAVALAKGQVSFSLGTDTAGSGRVPAAFNNLIGYKPTRGWISTNGVVPACRSLDCVSVFAFTAWDAHRVMEVAAAYDAGDIYSRTPRIKGYRFGFNRFCFGIPRKAQLRFFGNSESERLFAEAVARLEDLGGEAIEVDLDPFLEAAHLLYGGPWVAERYVSIQPFFDLHSDQVIEPVREIIAGSKRFSAADAFKGLYRLRQLKRRADQIWIDVEFFLTPTAGTIYTINEMLRDPIRLNSNLGYYTNFVNLLDYAAVAVPAGFQNDGLPMGVTLIAPAHHDEVLLDLAGHLQNAYGLPLGATGIPLEEGNLAERSGLRTRLGPFIIPTPRPVARLPDSPDNTGRVRVAVCGAHLTGLPLNDRLTTRNGQLIAATTTSADYKLFALPGSPPQRPGLVRVEKDEQGYAIEVEVWELPLGEFGSFVAEIPAPLGIGTITLANGETVQGFVCERYAVTGAEDISRSGGWREYLSQKAE